MENWDKLLEKYFEGQSSIQEEKSLKEYMNGQNVAAKHEPYKSIFIDQDWNTLPEMEADPFAKIDFEVKTKRFNLYRISSIAAGFLLLIFAGFFAFQQDKQQLEFDLSSFEPETEEEAYEQTLMALEMLSAKLNNGTASVEKGIHGLKKANEIINQNN